MGGVAPPTLVPRPAAVIRRRGGPGEFAARLERARAVGDSVTASGPLALASAVLDHQRRRAEQPTVLAAAALLVAGADARRPPLLDLDAAADPIATEIGRAIGTLRGGEHLPPPLREAGAALVQLDTAAVGELVRTWLDDVQLVDPRLGFWIGVAAAPVLELAVADLTAPKDWTGSACPFCGGMPQVSVIAERSGEFLGGSPRSLICARCAGSWSFPRATCASCGEANPKRLSPYVAQAVSWVRVDACETCNGYIKTFDLREDGAADVIPLVDDVASLVLDVWAHTQGLHRPARSFAGV